MPEYKYKCDDCEHTYFVAKRFCEMDDPETCVSCNSSKTNRIFVLPKLQLMNIGVKDAEYNPAFGRVMTDKQAQEAAKRMGANEVGNEKDLSEYKPKEMIAPGPGESYDLRSSDRCQKETNP